MILSALDDRDGSPVDWWFVYKLPSDATAPRGKTKGGAGKSSGEEYLYFDARGEGPLRLSKKVLAHRDGALHKTLDQLLAAGPDAGVGWIHYNDEIPKAKENDDRKGHTKGLLAFSAEDGSALWLLHSTPRYPWIGDDDFPADEKIYGQTFLCVTLEGIEAAGTIAAHMIEQQQPQTYGARLPPSMAATDALHRLSRAVDVDSTAKPLATTLRSRGGQEFRLFAKNRHWDKDFWIDLVGPGLGVDLQVETWRRGTRPGTEDADGKHGAKDVLYIDLEPLGVPYEWHYTKDHAKWATSTEDHWVCVADINRQVSQEKRGGGALCFQNEALWQGLSRIERYKG